jgi:hypothetical protein
VLYLLGLGFLLFLAGQDVRPERFRGLTFPVLQDAEEITTEFGQLLVVAGSVGEFGSLLPAAAPPCCTGAGSAPRPPRRPRCRSGRGPGRPTRSRSRMSTLRSCDPGAGTRPVFWRVRAA